MLLLLFSCSTRRSRRLKLSPRCFPERLNRLLNLAMPKVFTVTSELKPCSAREGANPHLTQPPAITHIPSLLNSALSLIGKSGLQHSKVRRTFERNASWMHMFVTTSHATQQATSFRKLTHFISLIPSKTMSILTDSRSHITSQATHLPSSRFYRRGCSQFNPTTRIVASARSSSRAPNWLVCGPGFHGCLLGLHDRPGS